MMTRVCGYVYVCEFKFSDLIIFDRDIVYFIGIRYGGVMLF